MSERNATGSWIPLMEYSVKMGISLSTLRRYIKANKVQYRVENGRYLLLDTEAKGQPQIPREFIPQQVSAPAPTSNFQRLELDLRKAQEEITELKMLIALYEEKIPHHRLES